MASMEENDNIGTFGRAEWTTGTPFRKVEKRKGSKGWIFLGPRAEHLYKQCQWRWYIYTRLPSQWRTLNYHLTPRPLQKEDVPAKLHYAKVIQSHNLIMVNGAADIEESEKEAMEDDDQEYGMNGMAQWDIQLDIKIWVLSNLHQWEDEEKAVWYKLESFESQKWCGWKEWTCVSEKCQKEWKTKRKVWKEWEKKKKREIWVWWYLGYGKRVDSSHYGKCVGSTWPTVAILWAVLSLRW